MSTPLVDIDANPRQPGFKATKEGSKIPSPSKSKRPGSSGRRNPFSVSTTGSPCYTAVPTPSKPLMSPTPASKLPRKSTPTQSALSKGSKYGNRPATPCTSLPQARGGHKQASSNSARTTPTMSCDKPLPSPPVAQLVNPQSPLKAQRTLVDAEAGTPTEEEWPILRPENVSPLKASGLSTSNSLPQRSVSEGSALRRNGNPVLMSRVITTSSTKNRTPSQKISPSAADEELRHKQFKQMTEPRTLGSMNSYAKSFHAFPTKPEMVIDSPLAHQQRTPTAIRIPPRTSSKRSSMPLPDKPREGVPTQPASDLFRSVRPGSTKWPALEATSNQVATRQQTAEEFNGHESQSPAEAAQTAFVSSGPTPATHSQYGSIDSISSWDLTAGSSLIDEPEIDYEGTVRVKRLSWRSSNPDSGPTLRISADADAVLLGPHDTVPAVPAVPALPYNMPVKKPKERSFGNLAGQISRQVLVKMTPSTSSRSPTPPSVGTEAAERKSVKISPIRSMQPPRKPSIGDLSDKLTSPGTPALRDVEKDTDIPDSPKGDTSIPPNVSQKMPSSRTNSSSKRQFLDRTQKHSCQHGNYPTVLQSETPLKAIQVLGTETENAQSAMRKRLPMTWMTPRSATFILKKKDVKRNKTSTSLLSADRFNSRTSLPSTRSASSLSSNVAWSTPSQVGVHLPGPSRLGANESVAQDSGSFRCNNSSKETQDIEQNAAETASKIKAKSSFRNIFHRRNIKPAPQSAKKQDSKRSSIAGSVLAQRIRNSTNFSKVSLAKLPDVKADVQRSVKISSDDNGRVEKIDRPAALSTLKSGSPEVSLQPMLAAHYETATVIHKILDRVTSIAEDSPDRLRGLDIAEAVLHVVECSKEAKMSTELARKHARDAELNAERAGAELKRLEKLCEPGFDDETMQAIKLLIVSTGLVGSSETTKK